MLRRVQCKSFVSFCVSGEIFQKHKPVHSKIKQPATHFAHGRLVLKVALRFPRSALGIPTYHMHNNYAMYIVV